MVKLRANNEGARALRAGRPWLYRESLYERYGIGAGKLVDIVDARGRFLARGLYDPEGPIAARVLTRQEDERLSARWLASRLGDALAARRLLCDLESTEAWRWCNGEGDGLPGLAIDVYGAFAVVQLFTAAWAPHRELICEAIQAVLPREGIVEKSRLRPGPKGEVTGHLHGEPPPRELAVREGRLRFEVTLRDTSKTGLFLDQRETRADLQHLARGRAVLNLFCFTGSLSVAAAVGGAKRVTSVDLSAPALARARRNFALNDLSDEQHEVVRGDVFDVLPRLQRKGRAFDLVVIDPPAFSTSKKRVFRADKDWENLIQSALGVVAPGGLVICCSPMAALEPQELERALSRGAAHAQSTLRVFAFHSQPPDHPVDPACPEGRYLKVFYALKR